MKKGMFLWCIIVSVIFLSVGAMQRPADTKDLDCDGRLILRVYACPDCSYRTDCWASLVHHSCEKVQQVLERAAQTYRICILREPPKPYVCGGHNLRTKR